MLKYILQIYLITFSTLLYSQRNVSGVIVDSISKDVVMFASVSEFGTSKGTTSDIDGKFELQTKSDRSVLEISCFGCTKRKIEIFTDTLIEINILCDLDLGKYSNEPAIGEGRKKWLASINEVNLPSHDACENCNSYRFTKLSTFQNPICIRLDQCGSNYEMTYTIGNGKSGYNPNGAKKKRKKKISADIWNYYSSLLKKTGFDTVSNNHYKIMLDGTNWIFERKLDGVYKGHSTNVDKEKFMECGQYLIELAGINEHKYAKYNNSIFLNKDNKIVYLKEILNLLIAHLNEYKKKNAKEAELCKYTDYSIEIKKNGKLKKIKSTMNSGLWSGFLYYFEDKKCRNYYKKALEKIDLSTLNLKDDITIYLGVNYNEEALELESDN